MSKRKTSGDIEKYEMKGELLVYQADDGQVKL